MRYETLELTCDEALTIIKKDGWSQFCESTHGSVYYKNTTGEIIWLDDEGLSNYNKLIGEDMDRKNVARRVDITPEPPVLINGKKARERYDAEIKNVTDAHWEEIQLNATKIINEAVNDWNTEVSLNVDPADAEKLKAWLESQDYKVAWIPVTQTSDKSFVVSW